MRHAKKILLFTEKAWKQMHHLAHACDIEISAMGYLRAGTDNVVEEFIVPKQTCSGTSTVMDSDDLLQRQLELSVSHGIELSQWCVWWHSHVNMQATPSPTDENNIENLASGRFLWSVITNKAAAKQAIARENVNTGMYVRLDLFDPKEHAKVSVNRLTLDGASVEYAVIFETREMNAWATEVQKERVMHPTKSGETGNEAWRHLADATGLGNSGGNTRKFGQTGGGGRGTWRPGLNGSQGQWTHKDDGPKQLSGPSNMPDMDELLVSDGILDEKRGKELRKLINGSAAFAQLVRSELC